MNFPDEAIVLVGGLGTRLRPVLDGVPKALAPIAGRPFLSLLLDTLAAAGLRRVMLATGYLAGQVRDLVGDRHGPLAVDYSVEDAPLGTGGAAYRALTLIEGRRAWLLNGDTFLDTPWAEAAACDADVVLTVREVPDRSRFGAVTVEAGRVTALLEKGETGPGPINAGTYLLRADLPARARMPAAFSLERDLLMPSAASGALRLRAVTASGPFLDIGTPEDFSRAQTLLPGWLAGTSAGF